MKSKKSVSKDFGNLASTLCCVTRSLEDDEIHLLLSHKESGSIGNISADSWDSSDSNFVFRCLVTGFFNLDVLVSSSGIAVGHV